MLTDLIRAGAIDPAVDLRQAARKAALNSCPPSTVTCCIRQPGLLQELRRGCRAALPRQAYRGAS